VSAAREAGWLGPVIRELSIGSFLFIEVRAARAPSFKRSAFERNAPSGTIDDSHGASLTLSSASVVPYSKGPAATTIVLTGPLATTISGALEPLASTAAPISGHEGNSKNDETSRHSASDFHVHGLPVLFKSSILERRAVVSAFPNAAPRRIAENRTPIATYKRQCRVEKIISIYFVTKIVSVIQMNN
jgi:hypothetical protein